MRRVLVTGAAGYIGAHACVALAEAGFAVVGLDNFHNSRPATISRIDDIIGEPLPFYEMDVRDQTALERLLTREAIDAVLHFAGLKAVGESVAEPLRYYEHNVHGTISLCQAMAKAGVYTLIFSSSATVYDAHVPSPLREDSPLAASSPYGQSKIMVEQILADLKAADPRWRIARLRYFNPVGAHPGGRIGEDPNGIPQNLMPYVCQVAAGRLPRLTIHGQDYETADGTGVRDYIHVVDLVEGHIAALHYLRDHQDLLTVNLGTGQGTSVLQLVSAFERATGQRLPVTIGPRRAGDVATCYADAERAFSLLKWRAHLDLEAMCADAWRWTQARLAAHHAFSTTSDLTRSDNPPVLSSCQN